MALVLRNGDAIRLSGSSSSGSAGGLMRMGLGLGLGLVLGLMGGGTPVAPPEPPEPPFQIVAADPGGDVQELEFTDDDELTHDHDLGFPTGYDEDDEDTLYPLIIFHHGKNGTKSLGTQNLWTPLKTAMGNDSLAASIFCSYGGHPTGWVSDAYDDSSPEEQRFFNLLNYLRLHTRWNGKIVLFGFSMGGFGSLKNAIKRIITGTHDIVAVQVWSAPNCDTRSDNAWLAGDNADYLARWNGSGVAPADNADLADDTPVQLMIEHQAAIEADGLLVRIAHLASDNAAAPSSANMHDEFDALDFDHEYQTYAGSAHSVPSMVTADMAAAIAFIDTALAA